MRDRERERTTENEREIEKRQHDLFASACLLEEDDS